VRLYSAPYCASACVCCVVYICMYVWMCMCGFSKNNWLTARHLRALGYVVPDDERVQPQQEAEETKCVVQ
jgi:hypothetical protein